MADRKTVSMVTPCYNEADNVQPCAEAVRALFAGPLAAYDYEHLFCDNASTDGTAAALRKIAQSDKHVKVVLNSRNFGPFRSMFNGLLATSGDAVVCMLPADLQDPPEVIVDFVRHWQEGAEVVYGIRKNRDESWIMRKVRRAYYRLVSRLADITIPENVGEFQLVDRKVVEALRRFDDYYPYLRGMIASCGFRAVGTQYVWRARARGRSKNRLYHLVDQGLNGLISFSNLPMRLSMLAGTAIAAASLLYAAIGLACTVVAKFVYGEPVAPAGIPTLIAAVFFFAGVQLFVLGVIGEYISAIHFQVRRRPLVIERERINFEPSEPGAKPAGEQGD